MSDPVAERGIVDTRRERTFGGLRVGPGDRLVATTTVANPRTFTRTVENGEQFNVLSVDASGARTRAVAGRRRGKTVMLPASVLTPKAGERRVDHAYARTVHKTQGATVDRSILFAPDPTRLGRNTAYVGLTRARDRADLVTVAPTRRDALDGLARGMTDRRDHEAAIAVIDRASLDPGRLATLNDRELDEHRHALLAEARETITRLTGLDRQGRRAWSAAGDARRGERLEAREHHLDDDAHRAAALLNDQDPDGDRQRRGLMEATVRRSLDRTQDALAGTRRDLQALQSTPAVEPADAHQRSLVRERHVASQYLDGLLADLHTVHGQQIDLTANHQAVADIPEHERPARALEDARGRAQRVYALDLSAGQQLGSGHPVVADWLRTNVPRAHDRRPEASHFTPAQQRFADSIVRWRALVVPWFEHGGRDELDAIEHLQARLDDRHHALDEARRAASQHRSAEPAARSGRRHGDWERDEQRLRSRVRQAEDAVKQVEGERAAAEPRHGRPLREVAEALRLHHDHLASARRATVEAEQRLLAGGPAGLDQRQATRILGRRDELEPAAQRRYDQRAGQLAVEGVLRAHPAATRAERWRSIRSPGVGTDVEMASTERDHGLSPSAGGRSDDRPEGHTSR